MQSDSFGGLQSQLRQGEGDEAGLVSPPDASVNLGADGLGPRAREETEVAWARVTKQRWSAWRASGGIRERSRAVVSAIARARARGRIRREQVAGIAFMRPNADLRLAKKMRALGSFWDAANLEFLVLFLDNSGQIWTSTQAPEA